MTAPIDMATWVRESRESQGLPPKITDPATLAKIAHLLRTASVSVANAA
jgi:hypothetical protein